MVLLLFQGLEQRHNAVLQMYGEKAEECEELRMDLEDVKTMYKTQVNEPHVFSSERRISEMEKLQPGCYQRHTGCTFIYDSSLTFSQ